MGEAHEWRLIFKCPQCGQSSRVAGSAMGSVLRCPHCRERVVIFRDGIKKAPTLVSRLRARPVKRAVQVGTKIAKRSVRRAVLAATFLAILAAGGLAAFHPGDNGRSPGKLDGLAVAAESFQLAWLADDVKSAQAFVIGHDLPLLQNWWLPRRAALVASFGERFESRITAVEVVETRAAESTVRIRFVVRGREQQSFQDWKRTAQGWRLTLNIPD